MKNSIFLCLMLSILLTGCETKPEPPQVPYLFTKTDKTGTSKSEQDIAYLKGINVIAELRLLTDGKNEKYRVPLPDGKDIVIHRQRVEGDQKRLAWYGNVENERASFVFFSSNGKAVFGRIEIGRKTYRVMYMGNGVHQIAELDLNKLTEADDDAVVPKYTKKDNPSEEDGCPDPASDIDVMVVYTQDAETGAGGPEGMEALIYECVYLTNLAYENSDINQRLRLVHFARVTYTEAANSVTDRERLKDPADGFMDDIHTWRDDHGADVVLLICETAEAGNCGRAYIMDPVNAAHEEFAFGVVKRECAADNLSFPHELGHIMSARHHDDGTDTPYAYGHGFFQTTPSDGSGMGWETMLSKRSDCDRKIYFSNPNILYSPTGSASTDPMGTAADQDNHRVLNNTAATVANFRCSSPGINNVWMKDTWDDTGVEPDPATAGQAMYRSPYIWVRNAQDATFLHQHEHNDPEFGATNWIYVKMHNGSASAQSGNLELHIADASLSLTWPGSWTLVATIPVNLAASSTQIVEQAWNSVPDPASGSTHYCMIARWVSATDPMHTAEGSNIGSNVRENNNIVWRNLNVVDMSDDADSKVVVNFGGMKGTKTTQLVFEELTKFPKPKFMPAGKVIISFDDQFSEYWKKGGQKLSGLVAINANTFELAGARGTMDNLVLPENYKGRITIQFKKSTDAPRSKFDFSVKQYNTDQGVPVLVGGVDYELVPGK